MLSRARVLISPNWFRISSAPKWISFRVPIFTVQYQLRAPVKRLFWNIANQLHWDEYNIRTSCLVHCYLSLRLLIHGNANFSVDGVSKEVTKVFLPSYAYVAKPKFQYWYNGNKNPYDSIIAFWPKFMRCNHHIGLVGGLDWIKHWGPATSDQPFHYNDVTMSAMASQITSLTIVYSAVYSGTEESKQQSSASPLYVREIHRWSGFPAQRAIKSENVSIWWRHHAQVAFYDSICQKDEFRLNFDFN